MTAVFDRPRSSAPGDAVAEGSDSAFARSDHQHGREAAQLLVGSGVPDAGLGSDGNYYFRTDTPAVANQRLYVKDTGAWTGIL